jgi:hypothetical protein
MVEKMTFARIFIDFHGSDPTIAAVVSATTGQL